MNTNFFVSIIILEAAVLLAVVFFYRRKKSHLVTPISRQMEHEPDLAEGNENKIECNMAILDESGRKILESREIQNIPTMAYKIVNSNDIDRVSHGVAEFFKGVTSVPNKTLELVFNPKTLQGLGDGTYKLMKTKSGETLADVVDSSNKIVEKGRIAEAGKVRQLLGATFQFVSIAVAQSHLADIEKSLNTIKDSLDKISNKLENEDRAKINGAFNYLSRMVSDMENRICLDEISPPKRNKIEDLIGDSSSWQDKINKDMSSLIEKISSQNDLDTFGTGKTTEQLETLIKEVKPLLERRMFFLSLASLTNSVTTYLDPTGYWFSRIDTQNDAWSELFKHFTNEVENAVERLIKKAFFNTKRTLHEREELLKLISSNYSKLSESMQEHYINSQKSLVESVARLIDSDGNVHAAISFDDHGDVKDVAIL
ncbi:MAG: hypothetical protein LBP58_00085 [Azoarcus sp.]|jgi:hypothetical protein|nr:hypothetical protein [Azoarcus sp.]